MAPTPPAAPPGVPLTPDQKAQKLKALLEKLRLATQAAPTAKPAAVDIADLRAQIADSNRTDILTASQVELTLLRGEVELVKNNEIIKKELSPDELDKLNKMNTDISNAVNTTRSAVNDVFNVELDDIKDDIQPIGKDSISDEEGGGITGIIQKAMLQFTKMKLAFDKLFAWTPAKKAEIAEREKQLVLDEFSLLGARGLREKFKEQGVEYGVDVRNGIRDKTAFKKLFEQFKKEPGDIDEFVDQQLAVGSSKLGASKASKQETTMYGLMAVEGRESKNRYSLMGTEHELEYTDGKKYGVKFEGNVISVRDAAPGGKVYSYALTTGKELTKLATAAAKKAGAPGVSPDVLSLLGASTGTSFTSAEIEDEGATSDDKRLGFAFQGSAGPMGLSKKRGSVSLDKAALKTILKELAAGNATGLKKLVDRKIVAKGFFAKIKGSIEFKIEKIS